MANKKFQDIPRFVTLHDGRTTEVDLRELGPQARLEQIEALESGNYVMFEDVAEVIGVSATDAIAMAHHVTLLEELAIHTAPDALYREAIELFKRYGAGATLDELSTPQRIFTVHYLLTGNIQQSAKVAGVARQSPYNWMQTAKYLEALKILRDVLNSDAIAQLVKAHIQQVTIPTVAHDLVAIGSK